MPTPNPAKLLQLAIDVCKYASCRAILVAGWSELNGEQCKSLLAQDDVDNTIFITKSAPHDWLFPKCQAIIHHCGVGTMAAAIRSGKLQYKY
jgi:UDP:flavonoid glycosyltransferase YjiC (YdhE family)